MTIITFIFIEIDGWSLVEVANVASLLVFIGHNPPVAVRKNKIFYFDGMSYYSWIEFD